MVYPKRFYRVRRSYREPFVHLPDDALLLVFQYLSVKDLYKMRLVCRRFNNLILNTPSLFIHASFAGIWPSPNNLPIFVRATSVGNIETAIKLGISYLYNEGVSNNYSKKITSAANEKNAKKATEYFCQAENITSSSVAFIWTFIRPPWAPGIMCCKRHVFEGIRKYCEEKEDASPSLLYSVGKIMSLVENADGETDYKANAKFWLEKAAQRGSNAAKFELWKIRNKSNTDPFFNLQQLRDLRECLPHNKEAELELAMNYAAGNVGNLDRETTALYIKQFMANSRPCRIRGLFKFQLEVTRVMRYILVDWLVEVCTMKNFSGHVLHAAVSYVDLYLHRRKSHRSELQLLGIVCMLIASRFFEKNIVTIRESSWLTDNTYSYEQVVRMIGEVMSCLRGETQVLTLPNYVRLSCELMKVERKIENLASYIADMSLLRVTTGRHSCAVMGFSCTLLAQLIFYPEASWCPSFEIYLPFQRNTVLSCMVYLFETCLAEDCPMDIQNGRLKAVKERYESPNFSSVSNLKMPSTEEIRNLIISFRILEHNTDQLPEDSLPILNMSSTSGYDGDEEDLGENMDSDDDEVMAWYDDELERVEDKSSPKATSKNTPDEQHRERSTPSFLSPSWFQDVVNQSVLTSTGSRRVNSVGNESSVRKEHNSVCTPANVHRRPLIDVNNRPHSSENSEKRAQFRPIDNTPTHENMDMN
ncbi:cyclin-F-like [Dendronephthya gigantea]|uniref:cyclin-F-like n=1 Tax=Dendronephthya gigantea TaxID=151771 RepID=UPI00106A8190|nr:cyclin-F-like [Dendronephthya gigantea]